MLCLDVDYEFFGGLTSSNQENLTSNNGGKTFNFNQNSGHIEI